jgi:uncharacterized protein (DUF302 family)
MKKLLFIVFMGLSLFSSAQSGLMEVKSPHDFSQSCLRLEMFIKQAGLKLFAVYDHSSQAAAVGLPLDSVKVYVLGNPRAGTLLMQANPAIAQELPLRIGVYKRNKEVFLAYTNPQSWVNTYQLASQQALIDKMSALLAELCVKTALD